MPFQKKAASKFSHDVTNTCANLIGLDDFVKNLEKDFYAKVKVKCFYHAVEEKKDLILDIVCNYRLTETLHLFNSENWGGFALTKENGDVSSSFEKAFETLTQINNNEVDIAEISLHFKDTSIIISRIHDFSVPEQLAEIITKVSEHFVYFTKGLTEMPYEIFVPVFEDPAHNVFDLEQNYFDFWGIYFEDNMEHSGMVYSLSAKKLSKEDFFLLE